MRKFIVILLLAFTNIGFADVDPDLRQQAEQGDASAQYNLGLIYVKKQNTQQAFNWFLAAAKQGVMQAQHNVGVMYQRGNGTEQNDKEATFWYTAASNQGYAASQLNLALMHYTGQSGKRDEKKAGDLFLKACKAGIKKSCTMHSVLIKE